MRSGLENPLEDKGPTDHLNFRMDTNGKGLKSIKKLENLWIHNFIYMGGTNWPPFEDSRYQFSYLKTG